MCFSDVIVRIGALSDHCQDVGYHGRDYLGYNPNCNVGVGNFFWKFINYMIIKIGLDNPTETLNDDLKTFNNKIILNYRNDGRKIPNNINDTIDKIKLYSMLNNITLTDIIRCYFLSRRGEANVILIFMSEMIYPLYQLLLKAHQVPEDDHLLSVSKSIISIKYHAVHKNGFV